LVENNSDGALQAAAKLAEARIKIMESFEELTAMMQSTFEKRALYPDNKDLKSVAIKLYVTILNALDEMISWFTQNSFSKLLTEQAHRLKLISDTEKYNAYLWKGPAAYKKLDDLLHRAHRLQDAFLNKTATLEGLVHRKTETSVAKMMTYVPHIPLVRRDTGTIKRELRGSRDEFKDFMTRDHEWKKSQEAGLESKKWLIEQCLELLHHAQCKLSITRISSSDTYVPREFIEKIFVAPTGLL
jgi:hypothetical protein